MITHNIYRTGPVFKKPIRNFNKFHPCRVNFMYIL